MTLWEPLYLQWKWYVFHERVGRTDHFYSNYQCFLNAIFTSQNIKYSIRITRYSEKWKSRSENLVFAIEMKWFPMMFHGNHLISIAKHRVFRTRVHFISTRNLVPSFRFWARMRTDRAPCLDDEEIDRGLLEQQVKSVQRPSWRLPRKTGNSI